MKSHLISFILILFLAPLVGHCQTRGQTDSSHTLYWFVNGEGVFFNKYNARDQKFQHRLKELVVKEKIDTILILLNRYVNIVDSLNNLQMNDREYLIYRKTGKVYVDYFYYTRLTDLYDGKGKSSLRNRLNSGEKIFDYFINNKIDTVKRAFAFNTNYTVSDDLSGYDGFINVGKEFYSIGGIEGFRVNEVKEDPRLLFYEFIMHCLRSEGY